MCLPYDVVAFPGIVEGEPNAAIDTDADHFDRAADHDVTVRVRRSVAEWIGLVLEMHYGGGSVRYQWHGAELHIHDDPWAMPGEQPRIIHPDADGRYPLPYHWLPLSSRRAERVRDDHQDALDILAGDELARNRRPWMVEPMLDYLSQPQAVRPDEPSAPLPHHRAEHRRAALLEAIAIFDASVAEDRENDRIAALRGQATEFVLDYLQYCMTAAAHTIHRFHPTVTTAVVNTTWWRESGIDVDIVDLYDGAGHPVPVTDDPKWYRAEKNVCGWLTDTLNFAYPTDPVRQPRHDGPPGRAWSTVDLSWALRTEAADKEQENGPFDGQAATGGPDEVHPWEAWGAASMPEPPGLHVLVEHAAAPREGEIACRFDDTEDADGTTFPTSF